MCPTLRTGRHGILYVKNKNLHKLSGLESLLLQGFPKEYVLKAKNLSNTKLLSQTGNAMTVNVIKALQHYSNGGARISPKGSIYIGKVIIQRKGGDGGRNTANMLQFKLDPTELFDI